MKTNVKVKTETVRTHGGGISRNVPAIEELRRTVCANMLWENQFYESGESSANRIRDLVARVPFDDAAAIALEAREDMKLRHVPLLIVRELIRSHQGSKVGGLIFNVIQRADEIMELVAIYWKDQPGAPFTRQMKIGLGRAIGKFPEHQLAKYNRDGAVKLRDVLFLSHARPKDADKRVKYTRKERKIANKYKLLPHELLYKRITDKELKTPDTWEVALSTGGDKRGEFTRLMKEKKLGGLALLRNLRGMLEAGVDEKLIRSALSEMRGDRILPFRYVAAAKHAPKLEDAIDGAMLKALGEMQKLPGKTVIVIDVSGSMYGGNISEKSDMNRALAACALGAIGRELCEQVAVYATAGSDSRRKHKTEIVPARRGMALVEAVYKMSTPLGGGGIFIRQCMDYIRGIEKDADRTIVITDEQDCDVENRKSAEAMGNGYIINIASYQNGIEYGSWTKIHGWSEAIFSYIAAAESNWQKAR